MKPGLKTWMVALAAMAVSGCAVMAPQSSELGAVDVEAVSVAPVLPDVELTPLLLNKYLLAEIAIQRAQYGVAVDLYREVSLATKDPRLLERATRVALFARNRLAALETGRLWVELVPGSVEARQIMTALLVKEGDYDAALGLLESLLQEAGNDEQKRYVLILRLLGREQDKDGARALLEQYLAKYPEDVAALYALAQLALRDGKTEMSESAIDRLLLLKKDWTLAVIVKTRLMQVRNKDDEALAYLAAAVKRNAKDGELRTAYARMLVDVARPKEALEQFQKVLKRDAENPDILFAAALVALRIENIDVAQTYLQKLWDLGKRRDEVSYYLGRIEESRKNDVEAMRWYERVGLSGNYVDAQIRYAMLMARTGELDGARAHLGAIAAKSPNQRLKLYIAEGEMLREQKMYVEAKALYDHALGEIPNRIELLYSRAMVADKLGDLVLLERDLMAILENEPDHVDALNSLGYTLADRTQRYDEAYAFIKRALDLRPDAAHIMDSYGWVNFRLGRLDEALIYLRKASDAMYDPEIAAHLAEVLWVQGEYEAAQKVWDEALGKSPDSEVLLNSIKRLDP